MNKFIQEWLFTIVALYITTLFISSLIIGLTGIKEEPYPFFSWFVFTKVPEKIQNSFQINVLGYENNFLEFPILLDVSKKDLIDTNINTPEYNRRVSLLGGAIKERNTNLINQYRENIERLFINKKTIYEVEEITFDPIKRWVNGEIIKSRALEKFTSK